MDSFTLFSETVKKGLWIESPQGQRGNYIISDINGLPVASSRSLQAALVIARGKVEKEISNGAKVGKGK